MSEPTAVMKRGSRTMVAALACVLTIGAFLSAGCGSCESCGSAAKPRGGAARDVCDRIASLDDDEWITPDDAAMDALDLARRRMVEWSLHHRGRSQPEYAGYIYRDGNGNYSYTEPTTDGDHSSANPGRDLIPRGPRGADHWEQKNDDSYVPRLGGLHFDGERVVAYYHTHPRARHPDDRPEEFSGTERGFNAWGDSDVAEQYNIDAYLRTPSGKTLKYSPRNNGVSQVRRSRYNCADDTGDPHLRTFDGYHFDFQAAGEFVLVRSKADSLEVQVRLEPWGSSTRASLNTAVAMSVAGDRVGVYLGEQHPLRVNGRPLRVESRTVRLRKGGAIAALADGYLIVWPDRSAVRVTDDGSHLDVQVALLRSRRGEVVGLFGNADGRIENDSATRSGRVLNNVAADFRKLYRAFGDSWRVSQSESLFDYAPGESTETFTLRDFPSQLLRADDLEGDVRRKAERICRAAGVTAQPFLDNCILDVGVTGRKSFADSASRAQAAALGERAYIVPETIKVTTFDGLEYPLNVVGDYVLVHSTRRQLEIHVRLGVQAAKQRRALIFSGVGASIRGDRVAITAGEKPLIRVNGVRTPAGRLPLDLPQGGRVEQIGSSYRLVWPNGATLTVSTSSGRFDRLDLTNVPASVRSLQGLLGDADGDRTNDLRTADGILIPQAVTPNKAYRDRLNRIFAPSWRVSGSRSLIESP